METRFQLTWALGETCVALLLAAVVVLLNRMRFAITVWNRLGAGR